MMSAEASPLSWTRRFARGMMVSPDGGKQLIGTSSVVGSAFAVWSRHVLRSPRLTGIAVRVFVGSPIVSRPVVAAIN